MLFHLTHEQVFLTNFKYFFSSHFSFGHEIMKGFRVWKERGKERKGKGMKREEKTEGGQTEKVKREKDENGTEERLECLREA